MNPMLKRLLLRLRKPTRAKRQRRPAPSGGEPWLALYERLNIPASLHYPATTLSRALDQTAARFGPHPALIYEDTRWDYNELLSRANRAAGGLSRIGVGPGDKVLMTLPNCPEFVVAFFAVQKLGAVLVNAGPLMGHDDLMKLIDMSKPKLIIGLDLQAAALLDKEHNAQRIPRLCVSLSGYQSILKRFGYRYKVWNACRNDPDAACEMMFSEMLEHAPAKPPSIAPDPSEVAILQPTGGTTGTLKVARLTHANLLANATQVAVLGRLRAGQESVLGLLPMFHAYGLSVALMMPVLLGSAMVPMTRFRLGQLLDILARHKPTMCPLVPAIISALCDELERKPNAKACDALRHSLVMSGAAALTPALAQRFEKITGGLIHQGYGLTEASPVTHSNPPGAIRAESIGIPLPDTHARIAHMLDPKLDAPHGEPGELLIRGPQVFSGYFENAQQTERVLKKDSRGRLWLHTGDVARMDGDGYFYIVDRFKDMINRGGEKVWPARVERVVMLHEQVADVAVIGRPDDKLGERSVAMIQLRSPIEDEPQFYNALRSLCRQHLGPHEIPDEFEVVETIPRSALGKLLKYQLREPTTR